MFTGSLVALVTPFDEHDRVDYAALKRLIEFHVAEGSDGLVIAGTTGEAATLSRNEHVELIFRAVELAAGRIPVVAGTGSNSTAQTIDLSLAVGEAGIDAYLLVVPYYNKPTQEGMLRHFQTVADAVSKPVMLYNVPGRTGCDMLPATVGKAAIHGNIFGIKEATGNIQRLKDIQGCVDTGFRLYSGDDFTVLQFLEQGGHGVVTVSGNVVPAAMARLCALARKGEFSAAKVIDDSLQPLNTALFIESNPIPVKWAVSEMGLIAPILRLPLTEFPGQYHAQMRAALANAGVSLEDAA
ncbi:MAG: 4-hydroxy-tetrahydrodipicolinate synthase [Proteobacteria bacterium]|nr:4-hydroxy-tetrahydrodipicolinate synthase [Pseudomonadota bacterium]